MQRTGLLPQQRCIVFTTYSK